MPSLFDAVETVAESEPKTNIFGMEYGSRIPSLPRNRSVRLEIASLAGVIEDFDSLLGTIRARLSSLDLSVPDSTEHIRVVIKPTKERSAAKGAEKTRSGKAWVQKAPGSRENAIAANSREPRAIVPSVPEVIPADIVEAVFIDGHPVIYSLEKLLPVSPPERKSRSGQGTKRATARAVHKRRKKTIALGSIDGTGKFYDTVLGACNVRVDSKTSRVYVDVIDANSRLVTVQTLYLYYQVVPIVQWRWFASHRDCGEFTKWLNRRDGYDIIPAAIDANERETHAAIEFSINNPPLPTQFENYRIIESRGFVSVTNGHHTVPIARRENADHGWHIVFDRKLYDLDRSDATIAVSRDFYSNLTKVVGGLYKHLVQPERRIMHAQKRRCATIAKALATIEGFDKVEPDDLRNTVAPLTLEILDRNGFHWKDATKKDPDRALEPGEKLPIVVLCGKASKERDEDAIATLAAYAQIALRFLVNRR